MWAWERPEISIVHGQNDHLDNPWAANSVFGRQEPEVHNIAGVRRKQQKHCFGPPNVVAMDGGGRALSEAGCQAWNDFGPQSDPQGWIWEHEHRHPTYSRGCKCLLLGVV